MLPVLYPCTQEYRPQRLVQIPSPSSSTVLCCFEYVQLPDHLDGYEEPFIRKRLRMTARQGSRKDALAYGAAAPVTRCVLDSAIMQFYTASTLHGEVLAAWELLSRPNWLLVKKKLN